MRQILVMRYPIEDHDLTPAQLKREALIRTKTTARSRGWEILGTQEINLYPERRCVECTLIVDAPGIITEPIWEATDASDSRR